MTNKSKEIYLLSGLGADKRVFDFIDLAEYKLRHINWIEPFNNEPIEDYAKRLLKQIPIVKPILIGVSFGGMMAVEIGKLVETEKIILISSAKTKKEIPFYYKIVGLLKLHSIAPTIFLKKVNFLTFWMFGVKSKDEKHLLRTIINDTNGKFLKWAIDKIVSWKNRVQLNNVTAIHGTCDKILPGKNADFKITDGGHLMIVNQAKEISRLLNLILKKDLS